jgi:hypothetical protein
MIYFKVLSLCIAFLGMITTTTSTPFLVLNNGNITTQASVNKTFSSVIKKKPSGGFKVGPNIRTVVTGGLEKVLSEMLSSDAKADSQWTVYPLPRGDEYSGTVYPVPRGDEIPGTVYPRPNEILYPEETETDFDADSRNIDTIPDESSRTAYPADLDSETMDTIRDGIFNGQIIG